MNYIIFLLLLLIAPIPQSFGQPLLLPGKKTTEVRKISGNNLIFKVKTLNIRGNLRDQKFYILDKKKQTILAIIRVSQVNKSGFARAVISETLIEDTATLKGYPVAYAKHIDLPEEEQKLGAGAFSYGVMLVNPSVLSYIHMTRIDYHYLPILIGYDAHPQITLVGFSVNIFPPYLKYSSWLNRFGLIYQRQSQAGNARINIESTLSLPPVTVKMEQESLNLCYRPTFEGFISRFWTCVTALERIISKLSWEDEDYILSLQGMGVSSGIEFMPLYPSIFGASFKVPLRQKILMSASGASELKQGSQSMMIGEVFGGIRYRFSQLRAGFILELLGQYSFYNQKITLPKEGALEYKGSEYRLSLGLGYIF